MKALLRRVSLAFLLGQSLAVLADPEIMVHEGDLSARGEVAATLHANYTPRGDKVRDDGTWPTHHLGALMAEFATGIAPGWEVGVHLPVMRAGVHSDNARPGEWGASAVMFRIKHIHQETNGVFWGFNAEYDINARRYVADPRSIEFRAIVGWDSEHFRLTANPHLIWGFQHLDALKTPDFNVDLKALHKLRPGFSWGGEVYTDWGRADHLQPGRGDRTLYGVAEWDSGWGTLHLGIGRGFKETPEHTVLKAVWSTRF